jgi:hypothetical protein
VARVSTGLATGLGLALAAGLPSGCVDRMLVPAECGDGVVVRGEACFADDVETFDVPFTPLALRAASFDGDDRADILVTGVDAAGAVLGTLSRGGGDGVLAAPQDAGVFGCSAHPAIGHANGDDAVDLLVDACDDTMLVFLAGADGHFGAPITVDLDVATRTSAFADVDADGLTDVIALGIAGESIALTWARADGSGGYAPPFGTFVGTLGASDEPTGFSVGLLDGDALPDVVLSHADPGQPPRLALGTAGAFAAPIAWDELPPARGVATLDVDGRNGSELLVVGTDGSTFEVWRGRVGDVERIATTAIDDADGRVLAGGDVDGDGALDLAFFDPMGTDVALWLGDGRGAWDRAGRVQIGAGIDQLAIIDLDGDGGAELVAGTFERGAVSIVRGDP